MSVPANREVELKFDAADERPLARLRRAKRLLKRFKLGPLRSQDIFDLYWDTPDYRLARGGFGLRTRRQGDHWVVTLKELALNGDGGLSDRIEVEGCLADEDHQRFLAAPALAPLLAALAGPAWPPAAWAQVRLPKEEPPLQLVAAIYQHRDKREAVHGKARAELSLDTVVTYPYAGDRRQAQPATTRYAVELEAATPDLAGTLAGLARPMAAAYHLQPATMGKAEQALRPETATGHGAIGPETAMAEAGRAIWRQQLMAVVLAEAGVRCHKKAGALHDMRVATRRLDAAYHLFAPYFAKAEIAPYARPLRKLARLLGTARDLDVALGLLADYEPAGPGEGEALQAVVASWRAQRRAAYDAVQKRLAKKAYNRFLAGFIAFCQTPAAGDGRPVQVRHAMPAQIFGGYAALRAYEAIIGPDTDLAVLHDLRLEGKRLRYAIEFVRHLLPPEPAAALLAQLKLLQDCLGDMLDAETLQARLHDTAGDDSAGLAGILAHCDAVIAQKRADFAGLWAGFTSVETRTRLALALAAL